MLSKMPSCKDFIGFQLLENKTSKQEDTDICLIKPREEVSKLNNSSLDSM